MTDVWADVDTVRARLPALAAGVYLNTGGAGPLAEPAARAMHEAVEVSLGHGRMSLQAVLAGEAQTAGLRADVARLLGSDPEHVALTVNTTHGVNAVAWGIPLEPGDEVISTLLEHPGLAAPMGVLARRRGLVLHLIPPAEAEADLGAAVARRAGPRTRLVAASQVAYSTGAVLDVAGAARAARRVGALTLVDGAQSVGAMPVRPHELGVDAIAFPAHKWLLGPEGLGAVWLSDEALARVEVTFAGYESGAEHVPDGSFTAHPGARRLELSTPPFDLVPGWRAALAWLEEVGWDRIHSATREAAAAVRAALAGIPGVTVVTPSPGAGLVAFALDGVDPAAAAMSLASRGVVIRWIDHPPLMRASAGFFTDQGDVRRLADALAEVAGERGRAAARG